MYQHFPSKFDRNFVEKHAAIRKELRLFAKKYQSVSKYSAGVSKLYTEKASLKI